MKYFIPYERNDEPYIRSGKFMFEKIDLRSKMENNLVSINKQLLYFVEIQSFMQKPNQILCAITWRLCSDLIEMLPKPNVFNLFDFPQT